MANTSYKDLVVVVSLIALLFDCSVRNSSWSKCLDSLSVRLTSWLSLMRKSLALLTRFPLMKPICRVVVDVVVVAGFDMNLKLKPIDFVEARSMANTSHWTDRTCMNSWDNSFPKYYLHRIVLVVAAAVVVEGL